MGKNTGEDKGIVRVGASVGVRVGVRVRVGEWEGSNRARVGFRIREGKG